MQAQAAIHSDPNPPACPSPRIVDDRETTPRKDVVVGPTGDPFLEGLRACSPPVGASASSGVPCWPCA
ncbi:MAG: hypothetical protein ACYC5Q_02320 [Thermoleophilia bacterium]